MAAADQPRHNRPAQAPGSGFTESPSADDVEEGTFHDVLAAAVGALEQKGVPYLLVGGIAASTYGRPRWTHDVDLLVRPVDAGLALDALAAEGFRTEESFPDWLYKADRDGVGVDVIFSMPGGILLDDDMLARGREETVGGRSVRVISPEDMVVIKAVVHDEHMPRHWHDGLAILAECDLDWEYVLRRARAHGARRVLSLLLYAQSNDVAVPNGPVRALFDAVFEEWPQR
jgi:predicted nucleotidyltransferase